MYCVSRWFTDRSFSCIYHLVVCLIIIPHLKIRAVSAVVRVFSVLFSVISLLIVVSPSVMQKDAGLQLLVVYRDTLLTNMFTLSRCPSTGALTLASAL